MTDNRTVRIAIGLEDDHSEILIAELSELGFHGFEQLPGRLVGYVQESEWTGKKRKFVADWLTARYDTVSIVEDFVNHQNWNAVWEESIEPVVAGGFVVLPSWKSLPESSAGLQEIRIDPKMSFGTGHHETTRLMMELMSTISFAGKSVLDAGTGTAVLAIAAKLRGASEVVGFDIDPWSVTNAEENLELNDVSGVEVFTGTIEDLSQQAADKVSYGVIAANIIQNVIEQFLPHFAELLRSNGDLIVSGILKNGEDVLIEKAGIHGFEVRHRVTENEWVGLHLVKQKSES